MSRSVWFTRTCLQRSLSQMNEDTLAQDSPVERKKSKPTSVNYPDEDTCAPAPGRRGRCTQAIGAPARAGSSRSSA